MNRACLHLSGLAQSTRCFLWGIKDFWVGFFFFQFLVAVPRPMYTTMLASNRTIKWIVNNDDFIGLLFIQVNDQENSCKMGANNYILQCGFKKQTKGREIGMVLRYWWTGLYTTPNHKKNWLVYMLCRQSTSQLQSRYLVGPLGTLLVLGC